MDKYPVPERSYSAAHTVVSGVSAVSWLLIFGGVVAFFGLGSTAINTYQLMMVLLPCLLVSVVGFLLLALSQIARAIIHTAETNWHILRILHDQNERVAT